MRPPPTITDGTSAAICGASAASVARYTTCDGGEAVGEAVGGEEAALFDGDDGDAEEGEAAAATLDGARRHRA